MALTIQQNPPDYGAAYRHGGLVFRLSSDNNPKVTETGNILDIRNVSPAMAASTPGLSKDDVLVRHQMPRAVVKGDYVTIAGLTKELYNGVFRVKQPVSATEFVIEASYEGVDYGGTVTYHRKAFTVVGKLYLGNAATGTPLVEIEVSAKDSDSRYNFDVSGFLQKELSVYDDLSTTLDGTNVGDTVSRDYIMTFHERWLVPDSDGIGIVTDFDADHPTTDTTVTSGVKHIINAAPEAFPIQNGSITGIITDLYGDTYLVDSVNTDARFLTNSPSRIPIRHHASDDTQRDTYNLYALVEEGLSGTYYRRVTAYGSDGSVVAGPNYTTFTQPTGSTASVLVWNAGPKGLGTSLVPTNTAYYEVALYKAADITEVKRFDCYYTCRPGDRRFVWKNAHGVRDSYTFRGVETDSMNTDRAYAKGILPSVPGVTDANTTTTAVTTEHVYQSNSGIINREKAEWLRELIDSSEVWIFEQGSWGYQYIPVTILGHSGGNTTQKATTDIGIEWKLAVDRIRQRA